MMNFEAWLFQPLDYLEPFRPNRIDQDVHLVSLNEKRCVADPRDAYLAFTDFGKLWSRRTIGALHKERGNQDAGQKVALVPVSAWTQPNACRSFGNGTIIRRLANNIPPAPLGKTNWHNVNTI